jgi:aspartate beta-hydroxylase
MPRLDTRVIAQTGFEALRRGDAHKARESFERIVAAGNADAASYAALATACRRLNDKASALVAVERALALEPSNLRALILKADHLAESGDARAASSFYKFAVDTAPPHAQLPIDLRAEVNRAKAMCDGFAGKFEDFLRNYVHREANTEGRTAARFEQSLDILVGKKSIYFQQPSTYYFPELPQTQFYDPGAFPWIPKLEAKTSEIRAELVEVLKEESVFEPYVQRAPDRPHKDLNGMDNNPDWSAFYLWKDGEIVPKHAARCPRTMEALSGIPLARIPNVSPSVLFSQLRPGAHIPSHTGLVNTRLICHLPLIVPPDCSFRVGNDTRTPVEGKVWLFDDTIQHEAWNRSDRTRVILIFEIWRPELTDDERRFVTAMFGAIQAYSGLKPELSI